MMGLFDIFFKKGGNEAQLLESISFWQGLSRDKQKEINDLKAQLSGNKKVYVPKVLGIINYNNALKVFQKNGINISAVELSDLSLSLTSMEEARICAESTKVQYEKYETEKHDCENFSFALLGYFSETLISFAFGTARSETHRFNCMIDEKMQFWICEPQNNEWTLYSDIKDNPVYKITSIMM